MSSELSHYLKPFAHFQSSSNKIDILCKIDSNLTTEFGINLPKEGLILAIFKKSKKIERETGINPLCKSLGKLTTIDSEGNTSDVPILLKELQIKNETNCFTITEVGDYFLNPYLFYLLEIDINEEINSIDEFKKRCYLDNLDLDDTSCLIGNFHPYRFEIYRDFSEIIKRDKISYDLAKLLTIENDDPKVDLHWTTKPILQLDHQQKFALQTLQTHSLILHGPPGTGKSQLIGNAIGSALSGNLSVLMSSEKKASLDAVYKRLEKSGLHRFCLVNYSKNENKLVYRDLKKTWDFLSKDIGLKSIQFEHKFPFSRTINELISIQKKGNVRIKDILSKIKECEILVNSRSIDLLEFKENEHLIDSLNENQFNFTNKLNFNQQWSESTLLTAIKNCEKIMGRLSIYHPIATQSDIETLIRNLLLIQHFSSAIYEKYGSLICNKPQKIKRLYLESIKLEKTELKWDRSLNHWINIPSKKELELLKELASKKGITDRVKFKFIWKKWIRSTQLDPISTCDDLLKYLEFQEKKNKFLLDLKEHGIDSILDLKLIHDLTINHSQSEWDWYINLNEELKLNYKNAHLLVSNLKSILYQYFNFNNDDLIAYHFNQFKVNVEFFLNELGIIENLPISVRNQLQKCRSITEYYNQYYSSVWRSEYGYLEMPTNLIQKDWIKTAVSYENHKKQGLKYNALEIIESIKKKFDGYHELIETPNSKLSTPEQKLKTELKIGKRILVKEFGKVKNHLSIRKLYESEAKQWLLLIKPVLMTHPHRIASYFPPEPGIFDLGIIDEASQMPFKNAIGTLQRIKRVLIAGDENQMDPSFFFSSNNDDHSVFHQAKYHLKNVELTHHYRSESEDLIAFSNRHFYENKLRFIENSKAHAKQVIFHHYIEKGKYNNGINEIEAEELVKYLVQQIETRDTKISIGVVAFSEAQLKTILEKIPVHFLTIIEHLEDSNKLFFKTLDQVQGDECDVLIISFGYGRNKDGDFEMRFGPINQTGGEKRLNVLFSRAKKEIHFFSSVTLSDFPFTKNQSVDLLKNWFVLMDENKLKESKSYEIHVLDILEKAYDADDFTQLTSMYLEKGWNILTS